MKRLLVIIAFIASSNAGCNKPVVSDIVDCTTSTVKNEISQLGPVVLGIFQAAKGGAVDWASIGNALVGLAADDAMCVLADLAATTTPPVDAGVGSGSAAPAAGSGSAVAAAGSDAGAGSAAASSAVATGSGSAAAGSAAAGSAAAGSGSAVAATAAGSGSAATPATLRDYFNERRAQQPVKKTYHTTHGDL